MGLLKKVVVGRQKLPEQFNAEKFMEFVGESVRHLRNSGKLYAKERSEYELRQGWISSDGKDTFQTKMGGCSSLLGFISIQYITQVPRKRFTADHDQEYNEKNFNKQYDRPFLLHAYRFVHQVQQSVQDHPQTSDGYKKNKRRHQSATCIDWEEPNRFAGGLRHISEDRSCCCAGISRIVE